MTRTLPFGLVATTAMANNGLHMTNIDLGEGGPTAGQGASSNPYRTQEDDMINVDLDPHPAPKSLSMHLRGYVEKTEKGVETNSTTKQTESKTSGSFSKMVFEYI